MYMVNIISLWTFSYYTQSSSWKRRALPFWKAAERANAKKCICACDMNDSHVTWLIHNWHDSFTCDLTNVTRPIDMWLESAGAKKCICACAMTYSYVTQLIHIWHDWSTCDLTYVTWRIHVWLESAGAKKCFCACGTNCTYVTWLVHMRHDLFIWGSYD